MHNIFENFSVDKNTPIPMYYQISQYLIKLITNTELVHNDLFPPESEIALILGVGRSTVRQALANLASFNLITRVKGHGTRVSIRESEESEFEQSTSLYQEIIKGDQPPITKVASLGIINSIPYINDLLDLMEEDKLIELIRIRYAFEEPIAYIKSYLSLEKYDDLLRYDLSKVSLYSTIESHYSMKIGKITRHLKTGYAEQDDSRILSIKIGEPLFWVTTRAFSVDQQPVEYSIAHYRSDMAHFNVEIDRWIKK
jgi:GntR family transcriptional regulator